MIVACILTLVSFSCLLAMFYADYRVKKEGDNAHRKSLEELSLLPEYHRLIAKFFSEELTTEEKFRLNTLRVLLGSNFSEKHPEVGEPKVLPFRR